MAAFQGEARNTKQEQTDMKGKEGPQEVSILHLLGTVPSPARQQPSMHQGGPCSPPRHSPTIPSAAATHLPPPPIAPAMSCPQPAMAPPMPMGAAPSYRERLRAGGQGAFQRAFNSGLMPKSMKQEWNAQRSNGDAQSTIPMGEMHNGLFVPHNQNYDAQQNWSGEGQNYWYVPMDQQMAHMEQQQQMLAMEQSQQQMLAMEQSQMLGMEQPPMAPVDPLQMLSMNQSQMFLPQQPGAQLPQAALAQPQQFSQASTPVMSGAATPTDVDRCMAIIGGQLTCDKDLLAAQLRAAAASQCYED